MSFNLEGSPTQTATEKSVSAFPSHGRSDTSYEVYGEVVYLLLAMLEKANSRGLAVGITSIHSGEGVTYTTLCLAEALERISGKRIQSVSLAALEGRLPSGRNGLGSPDPLADTVSSEFKGGRTEQVKANLRRFTNLADILLVDCPALQTSRDALSLSTALDGFLMVLQAGKIKREEISASERKVMSSGGKLLGFILNRTS